jgi:branched-chain amino acid transport system substrate-binding protein
MREKPDGKIGVLYQNDDFGKDYLKGLKDGLGDKKSLVVVEASYETQDPTVDSQVISMKAAGCEVFVNTAIPKFAAQAIRRVVEIEWKPLQILSSIGNSVAATLKPAGLENAKGLVSDFYLKDPTDPRWKDDEGFKWWVSFMDKCYPGGDKIDAGNVYGPSNAATVVQVLKQCSDELTRENVMKQAANLHDFTVPMLLPGIKINTSPIDFAPVKQVQMGRFDGSKWELFGGLLTAAVT